jgi:hypothetical protein
MFLDNIPEADKHFIDALSILTAVATLTSYLPHIAAILTIVWTGIRIYETDTVQRWFGRKK